MMYDTIPLPIDGSEESDVAAIHAIDLATTYDATLHGGRADARHRVVRGSAVRYEGSS